MIDRVNRVFGYENLWVVDGSMIPSNLGVNPSLTITALAEHAMSRIARNDLGNGDVQSKPSAGWLMRAGGGLAATLPR